MNQLAQSKVGGRDEVEKELGDRASKMRYAQQTLAPYHGRAESIFALKSLPSWRLAG